MTYPYDHLPPIARFSAAMGIEHRDDERPWCGCQTAHMWWRCPLCYARGPESCAEHGVAVPGGSCAEPGRITVTLGRHTAGCPVVELDRRPPMPPRRQSWIDPPLPVLCPYCLVPAGAICVTAGGNLSTTNHAARRKLAEQGRNEP